MRPAVLLLVLGTVRAIRWLAVSQMSSLAAAPHGLCNTLKPSLVPQQVQFCREKPTFMEAVKLGALEAISECQFQFRSQRWNCSTLGDPGGLLAGLRSPSPPLLAPVAPPPPHMVNDGRPHGAYYAGDSTDELSNFVVNGKKGRAVSRKNYYQSKKARRNNGRRRWNGSSNRRRNKNINSKKKKASYKNRASYPPPSPYSQYSSPPYSRSRKSLRSYEAQEISASHPDSITTANTSKVSTGPLEDSTSTTAANNTNQRLTPVDAHDTGSPPTVTSSSDSVSGDAGVNTTGAGSSRSDPDGSGGSGGSSGSGGGGSSGSGSGGSSDVGRGAMKPYPGSGATSTAGLGGGRFYIKPPGNDPKLPRSGPKGKGRRKKPRRKGKNRRPGRTRKKTKPSAFPVPFPVVPKGTREAAFVHAIAAAGVAHAITLRCSSGALEDCGCDHSVRGTTQEGFQWSGCSHNVAYGVSLSKRFVDARDRKRVMRAGRSGGKAGRAARALINLHNNEAGRQLLEKGMRVGCKCHGVSGSCELKTCWRHMPSFREVGETLKHKFDSATEVRPKRVGGRLQLLPNAMYFRKLAPTDLVFRASSPEYCEYDPSGGSLGTQGRQCNATSTGLDGCGRLCCGRGYSSATRLTPQRCRCKFHWCCHVQCDTCMRELTVHTCN